MALNVPASGISYFTPAQNPPAGSAYINDASTPTLFKPLTIRGLKMHNRIIVSPMCQYSSSNGRLTPWHMSHLGGIFTRGPGLTFTEASAVVPEGRITPEDAGIWSDDHAADWAAIVEFAHSQNQKMGIQLAHAGRKASTVAPWIKEAVVAGPEANGWPDDVWGPSPLAFNDAHIAPKELSKEQIKGLVEAFKIAAVRSIRAGFDVIEIHGAHGYLVSTFLSPTSNQRTDEYGGSFENRIRFALEIVDAVRSVIPETTPLFFRISGTEGLEESIPDIASWRSVDTIRIAPILAAHGVDMLDVSAGGISANQKFSYGPAYQSYLAADVKKSNPGLLVSTVGGIYDGKLAQGLLDEGKADIIMCGRGFQQNPGLVLDFAEALDVEIHQARQIEWGYRIRRYQLSY